MTTLVDAKKFLVSRIKADTNIQAVLPVARKNDIRELEWQGTDFGYPNIRVAVDTLERHTPGADCKLFDVVARVFVFADDASSRLADVIAASVWTALDTKSIGDTNVKLIGIKAKHFGASWVQEAGVWKSEVVLLFQMS